MINAQPLPDLLNTHTSANPDGELMLDCLNDVINQGFSSPSAKTQKAHSIFYLPFPEMQLLFYCITYRHSLY